LFVDGRGQRARGPPQERRQPAVRLPVLGSLQAQEPLAGERGNGEGG